MTSAQIKKLAELYAANMRSAVTPSAKLAWRNALELLKKSIRNEL